MKIVAIVFLLLKFGSVARAQYGIPDDDDDLPATTFVRTPAPVLFTTRAPELQITSYKQEIRSLPTPANTRVEIRRDEATYSAPAAVVRTVARAPVEVQSTRYEIRQDDDVQYEAAPVISVRAIEKLAPSYQAEKLVVREDLSSYSPASTTSVRITSDAAVKQDSYSKSKAYANTAVKTEAIPIVKYIMEENSHGTFRLETVSGDGTTYNKEGQLKDLGSKEGPVQVMSGSYSYNGDDGKVYKVDWKADENGFQPVGDHLPK